MDERSRETGIEPVSAHRAGDVRIPSDVPLRTGYAPDYGQRKAGMKPGTYVASCDWCRGEGLQKIANLPTQRCMKCDGSGVLVINGERWGDAEKRQRDDQIPRPTGHVMAFIGAMFVIGCILWLWAALSGNPYWPWN